jgi:hypothetical protein
MESNADLSAASAILFEKLYCSTGSSPSCSFALSFCCRSIDGSSRLYDHHCEITIPNFIFDQEDDDNIITVLLHL